jgi:hypothetical protein
MVKALVATLVIFCVMVGWLWVQGAYARFAARHPDLGPYRTEGGGCGGGCACHGGACGRGADCP